MTIAKKCLKRTIAIVLALTLTFSTNFVTNEVKADATVPEGAKAAIHLKAPLEDGVYKATVNMMNANSTGQYSMGNAALRGSDSYEQKQTADTGYKSLIVVKDGKATAVVQFMPMGYLGSYGFMMELESAKPNMFSKLTYPLADFTDFTTTQVITEQRTQSKGVVYDTYNDPDSEYKFDGSDATKHKRPAGYGKKEQLINIVDKAYPSLLTVDVTPIAAEGTEIPTNIEDYTVDTAAYCHVFVPIMFSISVSSGDQYARLLVDWKNAEKVTDTESNLEYQLYRAQNADTSTATEEAVEAFNNANTAAVEKMQNIWPSSHLDMNGSGFSAQPVLNMVEPTAEEKANLAKNLSTAIDKLSEKPEAQPWDGKTTKEPKKQDNTLYIGDATEFAWFANKVNNGDTTAYNIELTNDIDLNNNVWTKIKTFKGVFNGNGYAIKGLNISVTNEKDTYNGLFRSVTGTNKKYAEIKNLTIEGKADVKGAYFGSLAASALYTNVENVTTNVDISGVSSTGGIIGHGSYVNFNGCKNLGNIKAKNVYVGGIASDAYHANFIKCGNEGEINTTSYDVGGIAGTVVNYNSEVGGLDECYNTAYVNGIDEVGGLVGKLNAYSKESDSPLEVRASYNTGKIRATGNSDTTTCGGIVAELVGPNAKIVNSFNAGTAGRTSLKTIIGMIAATSSQGILENVYTINYDDTPIYTDESGDTATTVTNVEYKDLVWFASEDFKTAMGTDGDKFEFRQDYTNKGCYVLKFQSNTVEDAIKAAQSTITAYASKNYKDLPQKAIKAIAEEGNANIANAKTIEEVTKLVKETKAAIDEIPNDPNYGLDLSQLEQKVEEAKKLDSSLYTTESWNNVNMLLTRFNFLKRTGFSSQSNVDSNLAQLNDTIDKLVLIEPPTTEPTTEAPTAAPTTEPATEAPTAAPTTEPATEAPTAKPTTEAPTKANPTTKHQTKVKVATVKVKYAKNKKRKKLSLKWIKVKKVNGYQISYSTNKKFKKSVKTITLKKNVSKTNIKVKKGKKYYVRIRAYIKTKNGVVYGRWSKVKSTKIRK